MRVHAARQALTLSRSTASAAFLSCTPACRRKQGAIMWGVPADASVHCS